MQNITNKFIKGYDKNDTYYEYHLDKKNIPTIFIHGVGLDSSAWSNQKKYFKKNILFYDLLNHGRTKKSLKNINYQNLSLQLNNLINYLDDYTEEKENMYHLVDDIYERLDIVKTNQKHNYLEKFIYLFDEIVDGFREAEKYLYFSSPISFYPLMNVRPGEFLEDEGETDEGETDEGETDEGETEGRSETENESDEGNDENDNSSEEEDENNNDENINENNHMEVKLD